MFITSWKCFLIETRKISLIIAAITLLTGNLAGQVKTQSPKQDTIRLDSLQSCVYCLQVSGRIGIVKNNNAVAIKIYCLDSILYTTQSNNATGRFSFYLPFNNEYKIVMSKPGYYDKFITVDTKYPKKKLEAKYEVEFATDMFKTMEGLDVSVLNEPLVQMKYDRSNDIFDFDPKYTQLMIDKIDKLYNDYRLLKKADDEANDIRTPKKNNR